MESCIRHQVADKMSSMMERMGIGFSRILNGLETIRDQTAPAVINTLPSENLPTMDLAVPARMKPPPPKTTRMGRGNQGNTQDSNSSFNSVQLAELPIIEVSLEKEDEMGSFLFVPRIQQ